MNMKNTTAIMLVVNVALALAFPGLAAEPKAPKSERKAASGEDLFAEQRIHDIQIDLPEAAAESLRKDSKQYVKATVQCDGTTFRDVGLRLKGGSPFEGLAKKPSLMLKFNEFVKDQEFQGRSRILLNSAHQDPTFLCEALGSELFRSADVPAAKVTFAMVRAGGKQIGLYVVAEAANKDFLTQYFKKTKGNLYEGAKNDITDKLEKDGGDDSTDQADLRALAEALKDPDLDARWRKLTPLLDVERFAAFAAVEVLTGHHDGYAMDRNNYRIYQDPTSGQLVFLPHDFDQIFTKADEPLIPEWKGLVAKTVFSTPAGQKLYFKQMAGILADGFKPDTMQRRINDLIALVRPALVGGDAGVLKAFDDGTAKLRRRISSREEFLRQQLGSRAVAP